MQFVSKSQPYDRNGVCNLLDDEYKLLVVLDARKPLLNSCIAARNWHSFQQLIVSNEVEGVANPRGVCAEHLQALACMKSR